MSQDGDGLQADVIDRPGPPPELRDPPSRSRALGAFLATFALAAFAGVVWYAYDRGLQAGSEATAPLIQADPSPIKVRPEQPGGLEVPNQDKLVYGALRPGQDRGETVERLLPPPEAPVEPPQPEPSTDTAADAASGSGTSPDNGAPAENAGTATDTGSAVSSTVPIPARTPQAVTAPTQDATANAGPPTASTEAVPPPAAAPTQGSGTDAAPEPRPQPDATGVPPARVADAQDRNSRGTGTQNAAAGTAETQDTAAATAGSQVAAAPSPAPEPKPAAEPAAEPAAAPPPAVAAPPAPVGAFRVQLGAFRDEAAARREWDRLTRRYPDVLSGLTLRVQQVDLGAGKGVFHRIQGGMLTEAAADRVCATLKSRNQACLLVRP